MEIFLSHQSSKQKPTVMKTSTKTTLILAIFLMIGTTSGVKAQEFSFLGLVSRAAGLGTGDMVFKGKNHNGVQWSFTLNVSYDSKPITPAKQCLRGYGEVSNGITVAGFHKEENTIAAKQFISNSQAIAAINRIQIVSPSIKEQMPAFYPNGGVINTQPAPALLVMASL